MKILGMEEKMNHNNLKDRALGTMIGLAVGDALGAPVEFLDRGTFPFITSYRFGGKFHLPAGAYTDDTAMALCLADSLVQCKGTNQTHQLETYLKWLNEGYMSSTGKAVGCGKNTYLALLHFMRTGQSECGNPKMKRRAGNGSLMRIAPVALFYAGDLKEAMNMAEKSSYTTHGLKICADACRIYVGLIIGALEGRPKEELLSKEYFEYLCSFDQNYKYDLLIETVMNGSYKTKTISEISSSGYVIHTLEASLWVFYNSNNFNEGVLMAVNLGNDADTVGAVYGQLAGSYYGIEGIDKSLRDNLCKRETIEVLTGKLLSLTDS